MIAVVISTVCASFFCAVVPAVLFLVNLRRYREPEALAAGTHVSAMVSVLIPARNEERNIAACVQGALASEGVEVEVLVLDDASTDRTGEIVRALAADDSRVRLVEAQALPTGWNGKQRACWLLAEEAVAPHLLFLDADVRLAPVAVLRCVAQMQSSNVGLLSGFPLQITVGWLEKLMLPLIHFVLLAFLPMGRMRETTSPAFSAGCGQLFLADHEAYFASGGHAAIRTTRHDGLRLPELFRQHGYRTDIFDLTQVAEVRMYDSARAVWMGLAKNATEGIATPRKILPLTMLLLLGQVLPSLLFLLWMVLMFETLVIAGATFDQPIIAAWVSAAVFLAFVASVLPRVLAVRRFRQPVVSALLHPVGVTLLLVVQWYAFVRQMLGKPIAWRSRAS